jgi:hypothetical protein
VKPIPPSAPLAETRRGEELWIPAVLVREEAAKKGIPPRMLRRLVTSGLLAAPEGRGRGRGRGHEFFYPPRVLDQLAVIADGRRHGRRTVFLRHWIWWVPGGELEDWEPWRRDRVAELRADAVGWDLPPAVGGELPNERERHIVEVATSLGKSRTRGLPRSKLRGQSEREAYVRLFTSAILVDDVLDPLAEAPNVEALMGQLGHLLSEGVDDEPGDSVGESLGRLFERGLGRRAPSVAGEAPGVKAMMFAQYLPRPREAAATLAAMSEQRVVDLRAAVIGWTSPRGQYELSRREPRIAAQWLLMWETLVSVDQRFLQAPPASD